MGNRRFSNTVWRRRRQGVALLGAWLVAAGAAGGVKTAMGSSRTARGPESKGGRVLRVGVSDDYPLTFRDRRGKVSGLFPELLEAVAREEGWRIEYVWEAGNNASSGCVQARSICWEPLPRRRIGARFLISTGSRWCGTGDAWS